MKAFLIQLLNLLTGLGVTLVQMFKKPCTIQYPEQRLVWPDRTRGRLVLPLDQKLNQNRCTACMMCQRICPNGSIEITTKPSESGKKVLDDYLHHLDRCTYCGLCVEVCPFDALRMSHEHEVAARDKSALKRHLQLETLYFEQQWQGGMPAPKQQGPSQAAGEAKP